MPQFNPPNIEPRKSKAQAFLEPVGQVVQGLPSLIFQVKQAKRKMEMEDLSATRDKARLQLQIELAKRQGVSLVPDGEGGFATQTYPGIDPRIKLGGGGLDVPDDASPPMQPPKITSMRGGDVKVLNWNPYTGEYTDPITKEKLDVNSVPYGTRIQTLQLNPVEKESQQRASKLSEMFKVIDFFDEKIHEIPSGEGLIGRAKGLGIAAEAFLQTDPTAAAYKASLDGLRSQIARGLSEVGNLAEQEQKFAIQLLPNITDNTETREAKLKNFRDYVSMKIGKRIPPEDEQAVNQIPLSNDAANYLNGAKERGVLGE